MRKIGLLGGGSQANEVHDYATEQGLGVDFVAVQNEYLNSVLGKFKPLARDLERPSASERIVPVIAAVGAPAVKKAFIDMWSGDTYATLIANTAWRSNSSEIQPGSVLAPNAAVSTEAKIGKHVLVNIGATISHDVKVGDFTTISPGAHIGGNVEIGEGVFVGIGATIRDGLSISPGSIIGAGAVLLNNLTKENSVAVGVPAKVIRINDEWLSKI